MTSKSHLDLILVKASGTAILTLALIRLPDIFRAIAQLVSGLLFMKVNDSTSEVGVLISKINQNYLASAFGDLTAFIVLVLLARWMFGFPRVMRSAFSRTDSSSNIQEVEQE